MRQVVKAVDSCNFLCAFQLMVKLCVDRLCQVEISTRLLWVAMNRPTQGRPFYMSSFPTPLLFVHGGGVQTAPAPSLKGRTHSGTVS